MKIFLHEIVSIKIELKFLYLYVQIKFFKIFQMENENDDVKTNPISGYNPQFVHSPKNMNNKDIQDASALINNKTFVKIVTIDKKKNSSVIEGQLIGLDSRGNIIIQYNEKESQAEQQPNPDPKQKKAGNNPKQSQNQEPKLLLKVINMQYISEINEIEK